MFCVIVRQRAYRIHLIPRKFGTAAAAGNRLMPYCGEVSGFVCAIPRTEIQRRRIAGVTAAAGNRLMPYCGEVSGFARAVPRTKIQRRRIAGVTAAAGTG